MKYVISATKCKTKKEALDLVLQWELENNLDPDTRIYEVKGKTFHPVKITEIKLKEIK